MSTNIKEKLLESIIIGDFTLPNRIVMASLTRLRADRGNGRGYTDYPTYGHITTTKLEDKMSATNITKKLLEPITIGDFTLPNRIVMASLTRLRADPKTGVPTELHAEYYSQRASAGLILSEGAPISKSALGILGAGSLYTSEQVQGWKKVTDAVHAKGGRMFAQLWHMGRIVRSEYSDGEQPIAPSPLKVRVTRTRGPAYEVPREMTKEDMARVLEEHKKAALNAKEAGFDGVELHAANGFLMDEFIRDGTNQRTDDYGGTPENRCRFPLEVIDALIEIYGKGRVGIKLSPIGRYQDMYDSDPVATYSYLLKELDKRGIAYVQLSEADKVDGPGLDTGDSYEPGEKQLASVHKALRPYFKGPIMINQGFTSEAAAQAIDDGDGDLVSFGKNFISNPDLVDRIKNNWPLAPYDSTTFYRGEEVGYTDYPTYDHTKAEKLEDKI